MQAKFHIDNNSQNLAAAKTSIDGKVETIVMDVSKIEDYERLKDKIIKDFGGRCFCFPIHNSLNNTYDQKNRSS
jgi:hypothetical protein